MATTDIFEPEKDAEPVAAEATAPPLPPEPEPKRSPARTLVELLMPMAEAYAGRFAPTIDEQGAGAVRTGLFTRREEAVLAAAGRKAFAETLDYTSHNYAVPGAKAYDAADTDGTARIPDAMQLFSLVRAASAVLADREPPATKPEPADAQQVELLAVKPGEYPYSDVPVTPAEARRAAYMQRIETPPPPAALASMPGNGYAIVPLTSGASAGQAAMMQAGGPYGAAAMARAGQGGCGCGACAGGASAGFAFADAAYDDAGKCKPLFSISCETRWRLRECFKVALCDALRCMSAEMCEDGSFKQHPDFKRCIEQFVCTMVACLPEAICPPQGAPAACLPGSATGCGCNFAVGN